MALSFDGLSSSEFEEFCADLLHEIGFLNIDWRKGTGLATSPADKGRDIICDNPRPEPDGSQHFERWLVDCKHFKKGVPAKELHNLLTWAEAERPAVALFIASNFLSNAAKDIWRHTERTIVHRSEFAIGKDRNSPECSGVGFPYNAGTT